METIGGGCLCGAIRLELTAAPVRTGVCHCLDCRKNHGALFRPFAIFPGEAVKVHGEPAVFDSAPNVHRYFCGRCGSPLLSRYDETTWVEIYVGALDHANVTPPPTYELWTIRREAWLPPFPGVKSYERNRE